VVMAWTNATMRPDCPEGAFDRKATGFQASGRVMRLAMTLSPGLKPRSTFHLAVLDWKRQEIIDCLEEKADFFNESHKGFAGASLAGEGLYAVDEVHLYEIGLNPLRRLRKVSHRLLNDAHHIAVAGDRVFVANSGLETVEEFNHRFEHVRTHFLLKHNGRSPGQCLSRIQHSAKRAFNRLIGRNLRYGHLPNQVRFANLKKFLNPERYHRPGLDLRRSDFRPHYLHPNHIWCGGAKPLVTLSGLGMVVEIDSGRVVARDLGFPHDGLAIGTRFFVTDCSTNELLVFPYDQATQTIGPHPERIRVCGSLEEAFLRGIACDGERVYLGLTARRSQPQYATVRVRALELDTWRPAGEFTLPVALGHAVFSLIDVSQHYS